METFTDSFGNKLVNVHNKSQECLDNGCPVHSPSDHHMKDWPLLWRSDRGIFERIDELGCGHPDPDSINWIRRCYGEERAILEGTHGCSGGCNPDTKLKGFVIKEKYEPNNQQ